MDKINKIINEISKLTLMEALELTKKLQDKWKINTDQRTEHITNINKIKSKNEEFKVIIDSVGIRKLNVIKELKKITGTSLMESKKIADNVPKTIKDKIKKEEAELIKKKLENIGAKVTIKKI